MAAGVNLPSQFDLIEAFDESLGLYRVMDQRKQESMLLLKLCEAEHFTNSTKVFCQEWMRGNARPPMASLCFPKRLVSARQAGVFIAYDDVNSTSLERIIENCDGSATIELLQALRSVGEAIDLLHENRVAHGQISPRTVLITGDSASALVDSRLKTELQRQLKVVRTSAATIADDRQSLAQILDEILFSNETARQNHFQRSQLREQQVRKTIEQFCRASSLSCVDCIDAIVGHLKSRPEFSKSTRWEMIVEFLDEDGANHETAVEARSELPQLRSKLAAGLSAASPDMAPSMMNGTQTPGVDATSTRTQMPINHGVDSRNPVVIATSVAKSSSYHSSNSSGAAVDTASGTSREINGQSLREINGQSLQVQTSDPSALVQLSVVNKSAGPSNRLIGGVFVFSTMVLALVIGFKLMPAISTPVIVSTPSVSTPPNTAVSDVQAKNQDLIAARQDAVAVNCSSIAPKTWKLAEARFDDANTLGNIGQKTDYIISADAAIVLYKKAVAITQHYQAYQAKLNEPSNLDERSIAPELIRQEEKDYQAAFQIIQQSRDSAANEDFVEAASKFVDAQNRLHQLEIPARLKAAQAENKPETKIGLLAPIMDQATGTPEIGSIISDILDQNPELWIVEAERRIQKLGPSETVVAWCEFAQATHAMSLAEKSNKGLVQATKAVEQLPATKDDEQAMSAVVRLLEVVSLFGTDVQRRLASDSVARWSATKLTDSLDAALIAGYCFRLNNHSAWESITRASLSSVAKAELADDIVATNFVTAFGTRAEPQAINLVTRQASNAPVAAALVGLSAAQRDDQSAAAMIEQVERAIPLPDGTSLSVSLAYEIVAAAKVLRTNENPPGSFDPPSRLKGFASSLECQKKSMSGDLDVALKLWETIPEGFLLKASATTALVQCAMRNEWKSSDVVQWTSKLNQRRELDKVVAFLAAGSRQADIPNSSDSEGQTTLELKKGSVLTFKEISAQIRTGGGLSFGASRKSSRTKDVGTIRLFVRSVKDGAIAAFVEFPQRNEVHFCSGTYSNGMLQCELTPVITSRSNSDASPAKLFALLDRQGGMAIQTDEKGGLHPSIAAMDGSTEIRTYSPDDSLKLEELEARLLLSQLAHGVGEQKETLPIVQWTDAPRVFYAGSAGNSKQQQKNEAVAIQAYANLFGNKKPTGAFGNARRLDKRPDQDTKLILVMFDRMEKHKANAVKLGLNWNATGPSGYTGRCDPKNPSNLQLVLLQIDPSKFDEAQFFTAIQNLWIRSMGLYLNDDSLVSLPFDSAFTNHDRSQIEEYKPLTPVDKKAIYIFLNELRAGMDKKEAKQILLERARKNWKFE